MTDDQRPPEEENRQAEPGYARDIILTSGEHPKELVDLLADGWRVISVTLPGKQEAPTTPSDFSTPAAPTRRSRP